jgi:hypothetical protein
VSPTPVSRKMRRVIGMRSVLDRMRKCRGIEATVG